MVEKYFLYFNISFISRNLHQQEDSLALEASGFKTPMNSKLRYEIEMRHRPFINTNKIKH